MAKVIHNSIIITLAIRAGIKPHNLTMRDLRLVYARKLITTNSADEHDIRLGEALDMIWPKEKLEQFLTIES